VYLGYYGLDTTPFHITPDPEFFFLSPGHKEAFAAVIYGVEKRKGFVVLTGEVGTGKTTTLRACLERLKQADVNTVFLFNPDLSFNELLQQLLEELGTEGLQDRLEEMQAEAENDSSARMLRWLHLAVIQDYRQNRNVALIIDEAQNMPDDTLEKLRMLSNLESTKDKLLQIVLVGQPELDRKLRQHKLRQFRQRVAVRATIAPLSRGQARAYIRHRIVKAGGNPADLFSRGALNAIVRAGKGIPRTLNILCDNALVAGYGSQRKPVTAAIVEEVAADLNGRSKRTSLRRAAAFAAALVTGAGLLAALMDWPQSTTARVAASATGSPAGSAQFTVQPDLPAPDQAPDGIGEDGPADEEARAATPDWVTASLGLPILGMPGPEEAVAAMAAPEPDAAGLVPPDDDAPIRVAHEETVADAAIDTVPDTVSLEVQAATLAPSDDAPIPATHVEAPADTAVETAPVPPLPELETAELAPPDDNAPAALDETEEISRPEDPAAAAPSSIAHVVERGDCLSKLVAEVYGISTPGRVEIVKAHNPHMGDEDIIRIGDTIVFPYLAASPVPAQREGL